MKALRLAAALVLSVGSISVSAQEAPRRDLFAGYSMLLRLPRELYDVTLISPRNYFLFLPLLPSAVTGTVEFRTSGDKRFISVAAAEPASVDAS